VVAGAAVCAIALVPTKARIAVAVRVATSLMVVSFELQTRFVARHDAKFSRATVAPEHCLHFAKPLQINEMRGAIRHANIARVTEY
ncbi:hypothetical protein KC219_24405, partial [Mycobacterium tuberculosis]|nr:hypothetical protein [Mycobacterium tuberculosis]